MSQILKSFMGLFLILTMIVICAGILTSYLSVLTAQNTHANMIDELENSYFYSKVISDCFDTADEKGYKLSITLYGEDGREYTCNSKYQIPSNLEDVNMARVEMEYGYFFNGLDLDSKSILCGYAR